MTPAKTPAGRTLAAALARATRRLRTEGVVAAGAAAAAVVPAVLLVGWMVGERWPLRSAGPMTLAVVGIAAALVLAVRLSRHWVGAVDPTRVAAAAERRRGLPEGALRGVVELGRDLPAGVSAALFERTEARIAGALAGAGPRELGGELGDGVRRALARVLAVAGLLAGLAAVAGFAAPGRARAGWTPLLHPVAHLKGTVLPPLSVRPGDRDVPRGETVRLEVTAPLRKEVRVHWRTVGDVPRGRPLPVTDGGTATVIGPVRAPIRYWVTAPDGAATDTFLLRPLDPVLLEGVSVDVEYPGYLGRPRERYEGDIPPLRLPEGALIRVRAEATRTLSSAVLVRTDGARRSLQVDGTTARLDWRVDAGARGRWTWKLTSGAGGTSTGATTLDLDVTVDAAPQVRITAPDADATLPAGGRQPVLAEAEDDHGVVAAALVFRPVRGGAVGAARSAPIRLDGSGARVLLRTVLDAGSQDLGPGDAVEYHVEVVDDSPARQVGRSETHVLRVPGPHELRERARARADSLRSAAERLAERSRDLEERTRTASRRAAGQGHSGRSARPSESTSGSSSASTGRLDYEAAQEAASLVREQESQLAEAEALAARLDELERALAEAGLRDPELDRRIDELRELVRRLDTPELRKELEKLREAVRTLDPEAVERALEQLAKRQEELRDAVERSVELMRRAAAEQELNTLAREAEEIASDQRRLAEELRGESGDGSPENPTRDDSARPDSSSSGGSSAEPSSQETSSPESSQSRAGAPARDSATAGANAGRDPLAIPRPQLPTPERAGEQDELAGRAERLNRSLAELARQLLEMGERESASSTGAARQDGESAQQSMEEAASRARRDEGAKAAESGERAAGSMADAAAALDDARRRMTEAWRREAQEAVRQGTQDALDLAQREEALRQEMERAQRDGGAEREALARLRSEQGSLQEGLRQLGQNLSEAGQRSGMVSQDVGQALARAMLDMQQTLDGMQGSGSALPVPQAGRTVESLNQLAMSLLQNDTRIQQQAAGSDLQEALRQLQQLADQQASLNGRAGAMAPTQSGEPEPGPRLSRLARDQQGIGRRVGRVGELLGGREDLRGRLDPLASEAESLAQALAGGRLDDDVRARQERLFQRLLDAGRSLEREEYSSERRSTTAASVPAPAPAALDPDLLDARPRYTPPTPEQLRDLPPAYRRLILEYFDRLNGGGSARPRDGGSP